MGAAVAEYTTLLALLVGGAMLAYHSLGDSAQQSFAALASGGLAKLGTDAHSANDKHDPSAEEPADTTAGQPGFVQLAGWYAALAAGMVILYLIRRRHRRDGRAPQAEECVLETIDPAQRHRLFEKRQQIRSVLSRDVAMLFGPGVQVRHLMSRQLVTVKASEPAGNVVKLMEGETIRHLLVCDKDGRLVGIISDRDCHDRQGNKASELMTPDPTVVTADTPIGPAITVILGKRISCLPVVDDGMPIGILTTTDLVMSFQCVLQLLMRVAEEVRHCEEAETELSEAAP
ncbi:MAG: CBS domain-containing protein [Thermoguttaceae bacterium]